MLHQDFKKGFLVWVAILIASPSLGADSKDILPTYNSDYFYYFVRSEGRQENYYFEHIMDGTKSGDRLSGTKLYIPYSVTEDTHHLVSLYNHGTRYTTELTDETAHHETIKNFFWQSILNFDLDKERRFTMIFEGRHKGESNPFDSKIGNDFAPLISYKTRLSKNWQFLSLLRYSVLFKEDSEEKEVNLGLQMIYSPNDELKVAFGAPGLLSIEYFRPNYSLTTNNFIEGSMLSSVSSFRYNIESYQLGLKYLNLQDGIWKNRETKTLNGSTISYNRFEGKQEKIQVEFARKYENMLFELHVGRIVGGELVFKDDDDQKLKLQQKYAPYLGLTLAFEH